MGMGWLLCVHGARGPGVPAHAHGRDPCLQVFQLAWPRVTMDCGQADCVISNQSFMRGVLMPLVVVVVMVVAVPPIDPLSMDPWISLYIQI